MSLITQCPACTTLFKVVPDQLRISDGWVRCGQCDEVFDANAHMQTLAKASEQDILQEKWVDVPLPEPEEEVVASADAIDIPEAMDPFLERGPKELSEFAEAVVAQGLKDDLLRGEIQVESGSAPLRYTQTDAIPKSIDGDPHLSFMRSKAESRKWNRRGVTLGLVIASLVLCLLLAGQVVVQERDRIAAWQPEAVPVLQSLCPLIGCSIAPLRQIESVVIDSSAFTKVRNDVYRLSFTLKNSAAVQVAVPALELTLTDHQDQPLIRKIISTESVSGGKAALAAHAELGRSIPVSIRLPGDIDSVSGYRLIAFYP